MDIQYSTEKANDVLIFTVLDEHINHSNAASLKEKLFVEVADGNIQLVLDLKNVRDLDSSGLGALLFGKRQANNAGGELVLATVASSVENMIRIAQLSHVFQIFPDVPSALQYFKEEN